MNITEALQVVIDLANENILDQREVDQDPEVLQPQVDRQNEAVKMVSNLLAPNSPVSDGTVMYDRESGEFYTAEPSSEHPLSGKVEKIAAKLKERFGDSDGMPWGEVVEDVITALGG